jgi:hypothetical protein
MTDTTTTPKKTGLEVLREPFPPHLISRLPKPTRKENPKGKCAECGGFHGLPAVHLDYVGHAALTHRLLDADPAWTWVPLAVDGQGLPLFDKNGGLWIKLTVCNVTRLGYGQADPKPYSDIGAREKEVIGDALRNAAMRFGAALDLWSKADLHAQLEDGNTQAPRQDAPKPVGPQPYPDAEFTKNFPTWKRAIESGKTTPEAMITKIKTKGSISAAQANTIMAITRVRTMAEVEAAMRAATDADTLAVITVEQVATVVDPKQRKQLMALHEELEAQLTGVQV